MTCCVPRCRQNNKAQGLLIQEVTGLWGDSQCWHQPVSQRHAPEPYSIPSAWRGVGIGLKFKTLLLIDTPVMGPAQEPELAQDGAELPRRTRRRRAPGDPPLPKQRRASQARAPAALAGPPGGAPAVPAGAAAPAAGDQGGAPSAAEGLLQYRSVLQQWQWRSSVGRQELRALAGTAPSMPQSAFSCGMQ